ncbi:Ohr subfamily peroxiredoxin [Hydrogenispora ethanolica]|uniref:Ohr subfamily peroxiredoxin n=1 Tax=Hydrogenispora ethanolica TaxID=1082276 RepID=A0A4R1R990_HYDET|nr:organic hydroperoxide resistance protein [Hydrogenispora ethanolica]TCL62198.1 Ohr subfamily peroxiredoxin [Hydrogenispora ethanolica]
MKILYQAKAISHGGRDGKVRVENSPLDLELAVPKEMGGSGKAGANPEQLFAAGYAACFENAILHVARVQKINVPATSVTAEVGIGRNQAGGYSLAVSLTATLSGVDQATAESMVQEAHQVCPYSNAIRGNVEVTLAARTE